MAVLKKIRFEVICKCCNKKYSVIKSRLIRTKACSRLCANKLASPKGISKGKGISRNKGAKHPYLSQWNKDNPRKGDKNPAWKGGITDPNKIIRKSSEMKEWKHSVLERDDYTCAMCGKKGGDMEIHHIKKYSDYPELRTKITNGVTLCVDCHRKTKGKEELFEKTFADMTIQKLNK